MMSFGSTTLLLAGWVVCAAIMLALWLRQRRTGNATAVDVAWAANLGILAVLYAATSDGLPARRLLVAVVAVAWSARLTWHLYADRIRGEKQEDRRYRDLRAGWGRHADRNFFIFYQAQALLDVVLSVPFLLASANGAPQLHPLEITGTLLLIVALAGETIADRQLARHRSDAARRGRTCRSGLWRYSRHPNYFFEWLHWFAYPLLAIGLGPTAWVAFLGPALMLVFLLKITGIPPTEQRALQSRGERYREYQQTTSAFFPWFPKETAS